MALQITSPGGSGEDSRNCFPGNSDQHCFLPDCGVRRELAEVSRVSPLLSLVKACGAGSVMLFHSGRSHCQTLISRLTAAHIKVQCGLSVPMGEL